MKSNTGISDGPVLRSGDVAWVSVDHLLESGQDAGGEGGDAGGEGEIGRGFESQVSSGAILEEPERLGPVGAGGGIDGGMEDSRSVGLTAIDEFAVFDGADAGDVVDDLRGETVAVGGQQFVQVESIGFPVLMEEDGEVERRL